MNFSRYYREAFDPNIIYIPVLAFGNENYEIFPEEIGFAHIYVKNLKECKIIYFGESGESEI